MVLATLPPTVGANDTSMLQKPPAGKDSGQSFCSWNGSDSPGSSARVPVGTAPTLLIRHVKFELPTPTSSTPKSKLPALLLSMPLSMSLGAGEALVSGVLLPLTGGVLPAF